MAAGTWKEGMWGEHHERQRFSVMTAVDEAGRSVADGASNLWL